MRKGSIPPNRAVPFAQLLLEIQVFLFQSPLSSFQPMDNGNKTSLHATLYLYRNPHMSMNNV